MSFKVTYENTPNPHSLKFIVDTKICDEIIEIKDRTTAKRSPLALKILGFPWAKSIFLGENFVTVTKEEWLEWEMICDPLAEIIEDHLNNGEQVIVKKPEESDQSDSSQSPEVQKIKEVLETEIQPAVAMDGGYIEFVSYEKGIVYLSLQGACSGCPSSSLTLKQGIEARLKQVVPEVQEVMEV